MAFIPDTGDKCEICSAIAGDNSLCWNNCWSCGSLNCSDCRLDCNGCTAEICPECFGDCAMCINDAEDSDDDL